jgi:hypothetical protein
MVFGNEESRAGPIVTAHDLVVFDTSTLPEYYKDVHTIIALPRGYVVTYDYSVRHVAKDVAAILFTGSTFTSAATESTLHVNVARFR